METVKLSSDQLVAFYFQRGFGATLWDTTTQNQLLLIEEALATCADADFNLEQVVVGHKSGQITVFEIAFAPRKLTDPSEGIQAQIKSRVDLGFHGSDVLTVKLSKDG